MARIVPIICSALLQVGACATEPMPSMPEPEATASSQPEWEPRQLRGQDLRGAKLRFEDLRSADLVGADLSGADLTGADLRGADLTGAKLDGAILEGAIADGAIFVGVDLRPVAPKGFNDSRIIRHAADIPAEPPSYGPPTRTNPDAPQLEVRGYRMLVMEPGSFDMGSEPGSLAHQEDEALHPVHLERPFAIGITEVTQSLVEQVTGSTGSLFEDCGPDCPADNLGWCEAVRFCNRLSEQEGLVPAYHLPQDFDQAIADNDCAHAWSRVSWDRESKGYRLPTEAEWEYAARAGQPTDYAGSNSLGAVAWYELNAEGSPHPVGQKDPNAWGLHDMTGNVWEWVWDWYAPYPTEAVVDPAGAPTGKHRIRRGGAWYTRPPTCSRLCYREGKATHSNAYRPGSIGLRLARSLE